MKVSISRSVGRAFDALEVFRETRKPASATELRRKLACPHSSAVAVLHNLTELGYLSYDDETRLYFPTHKLSALGTWVRPSLKGSGGLGELADAISSETGHTTAISCRNLIFLNIIYVQRGDHPCAHPFSPGIDVVLGKSIPGIAILSQFSDAEIADMVARANVWAGRAKAAQICKLEQVLRSVAAARKSGAAIGLDQPSGEDGAIAYPFASPFDGSKMCVSTTGPAQLLKGRLGAIRKAMEHHLRAYGKGMPNPASPAPHTATPDMATRAFQMAFRQLAMREAG